MSGTELLKAAHKFPERFGQRPQFGETLPQRLKRLVREGASARVPKRIGTLPRLMLLSVVHLLAPEAERENTERMFTLETKASLNKPREETEPMPISRETGAGAYEVLRATYDARQPSDGQRLSDLGQSLTLTVTATLDELKADWQDLQDRAAVSPYQRFDLAKAWVRNAAASAGFEARIGVVRDAPGRIVVILPFGLIRRLGTTVGVYLGGSHFNANMPLVDPELRIVPSTVANILDQYCDATGADLLLLSNQPKSWKQTPHPFLCLPHYGAPDDVRLITIKDGDYEAYLANQLTRKMQSELRRKTVKFEEAGAAGAVRASTPEEVERFLTAFIEQKSKRLTSRGVDDPFAVPGVKDFLRDAALSGLAGTGGLEMHAVQAHGRLASVRAGMLHRDHYSFMVQSFDTEDPLAKYSPSEYLMAEVLADSCKQGVTSFDFGVGDGRFKKVWSNGVVHLFNVTHAVTKKGQLYASVMQLSGAAIRYIKRNPRLFSAVQEARALGARLRGQTES